MWFAHAVIKMQYSREKLISRYQQGEVLKYVFFWGHTQKNPEIIDKSCFSQWYPSPFVVDDVTYATAEHYMMAEKAHLFKDEITRQKILAAEHPHAAKKLGRQIQPFHETVWKQQRFAIVVQGNFAKFSQYPALRDFLLQSGKRVLVEASPMDTIWGIGLAQDNSQANDPTKWRGDNLLGFALMVVRDQLQQAK